MLKVYVLPFLCDKEKIYFNLKMFALLAYIYYNVFKVFYGKI